MFLGVPATLSLDELLQTSLGPFLTDAGRPSPAALKARGILEGLSVSVRVLRFTNHDQPPTKTAMFSSIAAGPKTEQDTNQPVP